jgi:CRISPR type III-B/RAMP module-associated protein Cmr3
MKYLLTFKPLKNFFFGNDKTFSEDYVAISEYFPQNTQLLGAIRLFIAEQNNLMHVHKNGKYSNNPNELKKLIGIASAKDFQINDNLGMIQNLSRMFIVNTSFDDAYFPIPFDIEVSDRSVKYYELSHIENNYFLKNYDVKNSSSQKLGNKKFWKSYINKEPIALNDVEQFDYEKDKNKNTEKGFFIPHNQVGIGLENKKTIDGKFYSKTDYQLNDRFLFGCLIELDEKIIADGIIQIGAENSLFEIKVIPFEDTKLDSHPVVSQLFSTPQKGDKIVAISDVMLESTNEFHSYFTIVPYYKNFAMLDNDYDNFKSKTSQKRLIPSGSVSYISEQVMPYNPTLGAYAKMGYNQFLTAKN